MKKALLVVLCLLYILGPVFNTPLGQFGDPILFLSFILTIVFFSSKHLLSFRSVLCCSSFERSLFSFQFYLILPLLTATVYHEYGAAISISDFIKPIRILLTMYSGCVLVLFSYHLYNKDFFVKLLKIIVYVILFNALIMCLQAISEEFRNALQNVLFRIDDGVYRYGIELRSSGLFLSGGALPSVFQTIVIVFIPYLIRSKQLKFIYGILIASFLLATSVLTGRTGLLSLIPFMYLMFIFMSKKRIFLMLLILFVILMIIIGYLSSIESEAIKYAIERFSWLSEEKADSGTIYIILNKFSIPDNLFILFFGVLNFDNSIYTKVSDMGFNINLWTYGFLGWILFYITYFKFLYNVLRLKSVLYSAERILVITFMLTYLLFECKENMMYARNGLSILCLIFFGFLLYRRNVKMNLVR